MFLFVFNVGNLISKFCIFSLFIISYAKSQNFIDDHIKKKSVEYSSSENFYKACIFYLKKTEDSAFIYANRQLDIPNVPFEIKNYCHYFRAVFFKHKRMFGESKNEFGKISKNFIFKPKIWVYLGDIALEQENYSDALSFYRKIRENQFEKFDIDKSKVLHNVGLCHLHLANYKNAEFFLFKSLSMHQAKKDTVSLISSYTDIAGMYYEQYFDSIAIKYYKKAYILSKKTKGNFILKKTASLNMAVVEENKKDYLQALKYRKESESWNDSINNQSKIWSVAQFEKKLAIKSKQNEINMLKVQNKLEALEKNRILYITSLLSVLLAGGVYLYIQKLKANKIILDQKKKLDESNTAKDVLFSIISHDLRSYINSLRSKYRKMQLNIDNLDLVGLKDEIKSGAFVADSTQNLLNNLLHWALMQTDQLYFKQEYINIHTITEHVAYNCKSLMTEKNIFFENKITYRLKVKADQESLKIILRNILDNAIKYTDIGGTIVIYDNVLSGNYHSITIEDTGKGISEELQKEILDDSKIVTKDKNKISRGLGLHLCQSLVKKNLGIFKLESRKNIGTKITISLLTS